MKTKNIVLFAALLLYSFISHSQTHNDSITNNRFYIDLFCHYGFLPAGKEAIATKSTPSGIENVYGTYGQGLRYGGNFGYFFNNHISGELGLSHLSGSKVKTTQDLQSNSSERALKGKMLQIESAIKISTGRMFKPFLKFGITYGIHTEINSDYLSTSPSGGTFTETALYSGGSCFGYKGTLGADYRISKLIAIFAELEMVNITWAPKKVEWTTTYTNGSNVTSSSGSTTYVDKQTGSSIGTNLKYFYPFGSFGTTIGLKLLLGKKK